MTTQTITCHIDMNYKKIFLPLFAAIALTGCTDAFQGEIDELHVEVDELSGRIEKLEQLCSRLNDNIVSIQTIIDAIQDKDYVTGVKPLDDGTGYTIRFTKSETITIHHGRDGSIGADGKTPDIGLKQDSDGNWYWTLDGNWLLRDGKKVRANGEKVEKGEPGSMGVDGAQGKPGITPQLKIDEGWCFVSVDNGTSWTKLGKATG